MSWARRARPSAALVAVLLLGRMALRFWEHDVPLALRVRSFSSSMKSVLPTSSPLPSTRFSLVTAGLCKKKDGSQAKYGRCGEDSYTIYAGPTHITQKSLLAVADGVGGWAEHGGDSSQVSNAFMTAMQKFHERQSRWHGLPALIKQSFEYLVTMKGLSKGTTTICAAAFDHAGGQLEVGNIGDSQLLVVRAGKVLLEVEAGVWAFNAPNQIGFGMYGEPQGDVDEMVIEKRLQLQPGDLIVIGSDGLFDNVFVSDIARILTKALNKIVVTESTLKDAAGILLETAYLNGLDDSFLSPFAKEAIEARKAPPHYRGGKPDDISLILASVF